MATWLTQVHPAGKLYSLDLSLNHLTLKALFSWLSSGTKLYMCANMMEHLYQWIWWVFIVYIRTKENDLEILGNYIMNHTSIILKLAMCTLISSQFNEACPFICYIVPAFHLFSYTYNNTHMHILKLSNLHLGGYVRVLRLCKWELIAV